MRAGNGPVVIEAEVYRFFHQNGPYPGSAFGYRTKEEEQEWKKRDPLDRVAAEMIKLGLLDQAAVDSVRAQAIAAMDAATITNVGNGSAAITPIDVMTAQGAAIERKHRKDVAELVATCRRRITIAGHSVPVASMPYTMASDAGHLLSEGEPFAAVYWDTAEHRQFSLRSRPEGLDVAAICQGFGGGGHKHAAGFRVGREHELARA
jgi:hypothetical protein